VETSGTGGTTGNGGFGGEPICPLEAAPCCPPGQLDDPCCSQCTSTGVGGSGGGASCGGIAGWTCPADEYCDFFDNQCGGNDGGGVCKKRPAAWSCPDSFQPTTCGCDGHVYANPCDAAAKGVDVNDHGGCPTPPDMFPCGGTFCRLGKEYCERDTSDVGGVPSTFTCQMLPVECGGAPSCACVANVVCGTFCEATGDGGIQVTCPGG
jgi:hypothetical protein